MSESYKLIYVDSNIHNKPIEVLEERVNKYLDRSKDRLIPSGPPVWLDGDIVQTLVNLDLTEQ